jgi:hypothetical protein
MVCARAAGSFVSNDLLQFLFIPEPWTAVLLLAAGLPLLTAPQPMMSSEMPATLLNAKLHG